MDVLKISLVISDTPEKILRIFRVVKYKKIVFVCPRNYVYLQEVSFLKKIKKAAETHKKKVLFVCSQQFILDLLKAQDIEGSLHLPEDISFREEKTLEDFFPSVKAQKNASSKKSFLAKDPDEKKEIVFSAKKIDEEISGNPIRGKIFFGFFCVLFFLFGMLFFVSPRATIYLKPKTSVHAATQNFLLVFPGTIIKKEDESLPKIPAIYPEVEVEEKQTFPSGGRRYELTHARGKVTLFNDTNKAKFLVPSRLSTEDGLIFRFPKEVTIPPRKDGVPGQLIVGVMADEFDIHGLPIGERGNIVAGTDLFFPALPQPLRKQYYAKANQGPLVGGSTLTRYLFEEADIDRARNALSTSLKVKAIDILTEQTKQRSAREGVRYSLLPDANKFSLEILEEKIPEIIPGTEVQTFDYSLKVKVSGIVFNQSKILRFLNEKIIASQDDRKKLIALDQSSLLYQIIATGTNELGDTWIKISVEVQGVESFDFLAKNTEGEMWRQNVRKEVVGLPVAEAYSRLKNFSEIDAVWDIRISPFWKKTLPTLMDQISFEVKN